MGLEFENIDISLLDIVCIEASASLGNSGVDFGASVALWNPSITFEVFDYSVQLYAKIGFVTPNISISKDGIDIGYIGGVSISR